MLAIKQTAGEDYAREQMVARVWVDGRLQTCRAKDPSNCRWHRASDGSPLPHYMDDSAAIAAAENEAARYAHAAELSKAYEARQAMLSSPMPPTPHGPAAGIDSEWRKASSRVRDDNDWDQAVKKMKTWAGYDNVLDDEDFNKGDGSRSKQTALHEAAHAIMDIHGGLGVSKMQVDYQKVEGIGWTLGLTWSGRGVRDSGEAISQVWGALAGQQIDDAFGVSRSSSSGDMKLVSSTLGIMGADSPADRIAVTQAAARYDRSVLAKNINALIAVADACYKNGKLDGSAVHAIAALNGMREAKPAAPALPPRPAAGSKPAAPPLPPRPVQNAVPLPPRPSATDVPLPPGADARGGANSHVRSFSRPAPLPLR